MPVGNSSRFFAVLWLQGSFFRLKSAHRACGMGPSLGMRNGHANELQTTQCVIPIAECSCVKFEARCDAADRGEYREAAGNLLNGREVLT